MPADERPSAVLMYHRVASLPRDIHRLAITPDSFRSQLETLTRDWRVMPLAALVHAAGSGRPLAGSVALTFDDGYLDNLDVVLPVLEQFSAPATFFLTTAAFNRPHRYWWDVVEAAVLDNPRLGNTLSLTIDGQPRAFPVHDDAARRATHDTLYGMVKPRRPASRDALVDQLEVLVPADRFDPMARPLLLDEVRQIARHPLIDVGAHTVHHVALATAAPDDVFREVSDSRSTLERVAGKSVSHFAYPHGALSPAALRTVEAAGFEVAVTCEERPLRRREHPLRVPRLATREESGASLGSRLAALVA
jgi:peptidoglycan/xylan/chitin deacetylase (PgdA/CDA1 family)